MRRTGLGSFLCVFAVGIGLGQVRFSEASSEYGVEVTYGFSDLGGGVSFADFNDDGWDDITYATMHDRQIHFFRNDEGTYRRAIFDIVNSHETKQVIWVDYDNDGDKDFFATSLNGPNRFYKNDGQMTFIDITETSGLFTDDQFTWGASFGDIDNDRDLDVFISNRDLENLEQHNYLYMNLGREFIDITEEAGLFMGSELTFCSSFVDFDNDGYQDIYVANDRYTKINRLYRNRGDRTFEDVSESSGAGVAIDAMSTTIGDYNNDGWWDIYVTNTYEGNYHFMNNGDGTFTNVAREVGTHFDSYGWGAVFLDADLDADLDLYVSGMLRGDDGHLSAAFYENVDNHYIIPADAGFEGDNRISFSNAIGDVNNDGLPDIIVMNHEEPNFLWINETYTSNNWLRVRLKGLRSNRDGIGSRIQLVANGQAQYRYTLSGEGYLSQNAAGEFFGLGNGDKIDYLKVTWLSGTIDSMVHVPINSYITVVEGQGFILNSDRPVQQPLTVFPNPGEGEFKVTVVDPGSTPVISVFDATGKEIRKVLVTERDTWIDLSANPEGIYYFQLQDQVNRQIERVRLRH